MITYCVGCAKPVPEDSKVCPHCQRDFSKPVAKPPKKGLGNVSPKRNPFQTFREKQAAKATPPTGSRSTSRPETSPRAYPIIPTPVQPAPRGHGAQTLVLVAVVGGILWAFGLTGSRPARPPARAPDPAAPAAPPPPEVPPAPDPAPEPPPPAQYPPDPPAEWEKPRPEPRARRRPASKGVENERPEEPVFIASSGGEWRMGGHVFDLITLLPVYSAEVIFTDPVSGRRAATVTDSEGNYRVRLPPTSSGYDVVIRRPGYDTKYAEDGDPPFKAMSLEDRKQKAWDMTRTLQHKQLLSAPAGGRIQRDFALIPVSGGY